MAFHKPFSAITHESCFLPIHIGAIKVEDYLVMYIQEELFVSGKPHEYGFISEWLLNIWVKHNKLRVTYCPVVQIRDESIVMRMMRMAKHIFKH